MTYMRFLSVEESYNGNTGRHLRSFASQVLYLDARTKFKHAKVYFHKGVSVAHSQIISISSVATFNGTRFS